MQRILFLFMFLLPCLSNAQQDSHRLMELEKLQMPSFLQQIRTSPQSGSITPPASPVRACAEWEEIDALMITWTNYQSVLKEIVRYAQSETRVLIICSDSNAVINYLNTNGVPRLNITYILAPFNTIWCRDYGPWNVYTNDADSLLLVDWIYNRPRAKDDSLPSSIQRFTGLPMYQTTSAPYDLIHTGGNFMTDGLGTGFSSRLILDENPTKTESEIDTIMSKFMGITRYIKMTPLPYDVIHHIDMHIKLLDEETLLVGEYPQDSADGPQIEANLQYILSQFNSPFGTPYKIVRVPMPPDGTNLFPDRGGDYRTYTNAVFVNRTILLPTYDPQYDSTAIRIWRASLPGYNIVGIGCNSIIPALGAIHCITNEVASRDPLLIVHQPLHDTYNSTNAYEVSARIQHRSGISQAALFYRSDTLVPYQSVVMTLNAGSNTWTGFIPAQTANTTVYYFIQAESNSGKQQVRPLPAPAGYWKFNVLLTSGINSQPSADRIEFGKAFPNPSKGITCIPLKSDHSIQMHLTLQSIIGRTIQSVYSGPLNGEKKFFIDTSVLPAGVYLLEFSTPEKIQTEKLIVR